ncbi:hypothetical protein [Arsukibacterium sp.]|uniref:hypothetical protein n=1 Tax=Arsukibacterium sp. TaxID=1977258 RepID=UPI00299D2620|nr:hypothetical protein [Arsukibacterium sp.]MDX1538713.1 hypothetical protein [Arsukibacterium sp.]
MNIEDLISKIVEDKEEKGDYDSCASEMNVELPQLFNLVSIRIAENFMSGQLSYTDADFAMNGVWPVMLDYIMKNDIPLVEPCYAIYEAFDQGEYDHKDGSDPVEKYTKPLLIEVLANA